MLFRATAMNGYIALTYAGGTCRQHVATVFGKNSFINAVLEGFYTSNSSCLKSPLLPSEAQAYGFGNSAPRGLNIHTPDEEFNKQQQQHPEERQREPGTERNKQIKKE